MIDAERNAVASRGADELGGLLDGLRPFVRRRIAANAAARAVDGRAGFSEASGDAASGPAVAPATTAMCPLSGWAAVMAILLVVDGRLRGGRYNKRLFIYLAIK